MRMVKRRERRTAVVSLVLLDWSVREAFQLLHYLAAQRVPREQFEVVVVEFYDREAPALAPWAEMIDTWLLLEMPATCYYHKHLMYNAGIVLAQGDVVLFCDSDAMVRESFIGSIVTAFRREPRQVLHLDQFRNVRRDLYPFRYPSFADVLGPGCINNVDGRPRGLVVTEDTLHERNYGACMAARRAELVAIGGADEHRDYLGHICGPYDLTFRLGQAGVPERWHPTEFLYHTWHPGQAGAGNYLGPHDGRHMSTTALAALTTGRTRPLVENPAIARLRCDPTLAGPALLPDLIAPDRLQLWTIDADERAQATPEMPALLDHYRGYNLVGFGNLIYGLPAAGGTIDLTLESDRRRPDILTGRTLDDLKRSIDASIPAAPPPLAAVDDDVPILIVSGYRTFNIVWWQQRYYAIPQGEGAFDPDRFARHDYSRAFDGDAQGAVMKAVARSDRWRRWQSLLDNSLGLARRRSPRHQG